MSNYLEQSIQEYMNQARDREVQELAEDTGIVGGIAPNL